MKDETSYELLGCWSFGVDSAKSGSKWSWMLKTKKDNAFGPKFGEALSKDLAYVKKHGLTYALFQNAANDMQYLVKFDLTKKAYVVQIEDSPNAPVDEDEVDAITAIPDFKRWIGAASYFIKTAKEALEGIIKDKITDTTVRVDEKLYEEILGYLNDAELMTNLKSGKIAK